MQSYILIKSANTQISSVNFAKILIYEKITIKIDNAYEILNFSKGNKKKR